MNTRKVALLVGLLLSLICARSWGGDSRFFRVTCVEGGAPENLSITKDEFGQTFLEFDTEVGRTYIIETTDSLDASAAWTTVASVTGDGQRMRWLSARRWSRTFRERAEDGAWSVQQTSDGGYILAGYTESFGAGGYDVYLIETDKHGDEVWSRTFGGSDWDLAHCVQQTSDGGHIVAGETRSFGAGGQDVYLIKTDQNGTEVWSRTFGGADDDEAWSVRETSDGGYIVAGETRSFGAGGADAYLIKTDGNGHQVWYRTLGGGLGDWAYSVEQTSDGGYIVAGSTNSFGGGNVYVYLIKIDQNGTVVWSRAFGEGTSDAAFSVQQTSDGGYIVAGYTSTPGARWPDVYLIKTYADGSEQWARTFGGSGTDIAYSVQETSHGGYIVAGQTRSFGAGEQDVYLIKTDQNGTEVWSRTFGGSDRDSGHSVQQTSDDGYILAGLTTSPGAGSWDVYLMKADQSGNELWSRTFPASNWDVAYSVEQTSDGGYILAGWRRPSAGKPGDVYLMKADQDGSQVWERTFGGADDDEAWSVRETSDGGYIVAGHTRSFGAGGQDVYLIKTDQNGNEAWSKTFGGSDDDEAYSVQETSDGGYIVAGYTDDQFGFTDVYLMKTDQDGNQVWRSPTALGECDWDVANSVQQTSDGGYIVAGETWSFGAGKADVYLIKTDAGGERQWTKTFGGSENDWAECVRQTSDGGYILAGPTGSFGAGKSDIYLIKTDQNGDPLWSKTFGGTESDKANSVQQTSDGGYILAGYTWSFGAGSADVYLIKTDQNGDVGEGKGWTRTFGGSGSDWAFSVQQTSDGGYVLSGYTESFGAGGWDVYLIKTDRLGNAPPPE